MAIITLLLVLQVLLLAPLAGALDNSLGKTPPCVINAALAEPDWLTALLTQTLSETRRSQH